MSNNEQNFEGLRNFSLTEEPSPYAIQVEENKEYLDYVPFINRKNEKYSCACGKRGKFENYFNTNNFKCPNCGNKYFIFTSAKYAIKLDLEAFRVLMTYHTTLFNNGKYTKPPLTTDLDLDGKCNTELVSDLSTSNDTEFYTFRCREFLVNILEDGSTKLTLGYKYYKVNKETFKVHDMKGKEKPKLLSLNDLYETYKIIRDMLRNDLTYKLNNYNNYISPYSPIDYAKLLRVLNSKCVYQIYNNGLADYMKSHLDIFNKWNLDKTNLQDILGIPKSLCKLLNTTDNYGEPIGKDIIIDWIYTLHKDHTSRRLKFSTEEVYNILIASFEIFNNWKDTVKRENVEKENNIEQQYEVLPVVPNYNEIEVLNNANLTFRVSSYDLNTIIDRLSKLVSYGYNIQRSITYISNCYEKQGITVTDFMVQLEDYARMSKSMKLKFEKYPVSVKLAHDLAMKKFVLIRNTLKDEELERIVNDYKMYEQTLGEFSFILPTKCLDFVRESNMLRHCVSSYTDKVFNGECIIVFMRYTKNIGKSFITIEVTDKGLVTQVKGFTDKKPSAEHMKIVKDWCKKVGLIYRGW